MEEDTALVLEEVTSTKSTMGRVLSAWDSYSDCLSSLQAWLQQDSVTQSHGRRSEVLLTHETVCCFMSGKLPTLLFFTGLQSSDKLNYSSFALPTETTAMQSSTGNVGVKIF